MEVRGGLRLTGVLSSLFPIKPHRHFTLLRLPAEAENARRIQQDAKSSGRLNRLVIICFAVCPPEKNPVELVTADPFIIQRTCGTPYS